MRAMSSNAESEAQTITKLMTVIYDILEGLIPFIRNPDNAIIRDWTKVAAAKMCYEWQTQMKCRLSSWWASLYNRYFSIFRRCWPSVGSGSSHIHLAYCVRWMWCDGRWVCACERERGTGGEAGCRRSGCRTCVREVSHCCMVCSAGMHGHGDRIYSHRHPYPQKSVSILIPCPLERRWHQL